MVHSRYLFMVSIWNTIVSIAWSRILHVIMFFLAQIEPSTEWQLKRQLYRCSAPCLTDAEDWAICLLFQWVAPYLVKHRKIPVGVWEIFYFSNKVFYSVSLAVKAKYKSVFTGQMHVQPIHRHMNNGLEWNQRTKNRTKLCMCNLWIFLCRFGSRWHAQTQTQSPARKEIHLHVYGTQRMQTKIETYIIITNC